MISVEENCILQTKTWIKKVVIDCNFCPFAAKAMNISDQVHFAVLDEHNPIPFNEYLIHQFVLLDTNKFIETSFIIFPNSFIEFESFLDLIELADLVLFQNEKEGIYQFASFHPDYRFEGSTINDPANYTNRSIYPMLQILREDSVAKAREMHPDIESIPDMNIQYTRNKGLNAMIALRSSCT